MNVSFGDWWLFGSTLAGAVVGAVAGGAIAYLLARQSLRETRIAYKNAKIEAEKALVIQVMLKLTRIVSSLEALHRQTEESISEAEAAGVDGPLWTKMVPFVGARKHVSFDTHEMAVFVTMKETDFMGSLILLDDRHDSLMEAFNEYGERYTNLTSQYGATMSGPIGVSGQVGISSFTKAEWDKIGPRSVELDVLAKSLRLSVKSELDRSLKIVGEFGPKVKKYFDDPSFPSPAIVPPEERL